MHSSKRRIERGRKERKEKRKMLLLETIKRTKMVMTIKR